MSLKQETVNTYNISAEGLAKKFDAIGPRVKDIDYVFSHCEKENPTVLEIGCGNGRDAREICKRTNKYLGIDISVELLKIARYDLPNIDFQYADVEEYMFPKNIDIVFAFASLIHVPRESFQKILQNIFSSLSENGLLFISLKYSDHYQEVTKTDEFGTRTYWYYSQEDIVEIAKQFLLESVTIQNVQDQLWMDVLLRKNNS